MMWQNPRLVLALRFSMAVPMSYILCSVPLKSYHLSAGSSFVVPTGQDERAATPPACSPNSWKDAYACGEGRHTPASLLWATENTQVGICPALWKQLAFDLHVILPKYSLCIIARQFKSTKRKRFRVFIRNYKLL